jgi:hypothetical protein
MKKMKPVKGDNMELMIYDDMHYSLGELNGKLLDENFADWRCVVPEYSTYFEVSRTNLIEQIKKVLPYTNKSTNQVAMFVHDQILLYGCDIDFDFEMKCRLSYTQKQVVDFQIAFNGKFMLEALKNFKGDAIKVYSAGAENKALIISDGTESILIMPLLYESNGHFDEIVDIFLKEGSITKTKFKAEKIAQIKPQNTTATVKPTATTQKRPEIEANAATAPVISINQSNFTQQIESICEKYQNVVFHIYDDKISIRFMKYENRQVITGSLAAEKPTKQQLTEVQKIAAKFNKSVNDKTSKKTA